MKWKRPRIGSGVFVMLLGLAVVAAAQDTPPTVPPQPVLVPVAQPDPPPAEIPGAAHLLMDFATGQVLTGSNEHAPREPASITKLMTHYVVAAQIAAGKIKPEDMVFISENAWKQGGAGTDGSYSALVVNSKVKLDDVLKGLVIQSGNDAAIALAEHVSGSESAFALLMNASAKTLGMNESSFVNAHGLSAPGHRMSAFDVAVLARAMIRDFPDHYALHAVKEYTYNGIKQYNRNGLLWKDASVDGVKTGHTAAAGYCLVASARRGDQRMISVVLGIEGSRKAGFKQREDANLALLNWGFRVFETHTVYAAGAKIAEPRLWKGESEALALSVSEALVVTIHRGRYGAMQAIMDVPSELVAPIAAGDRIGRIRLELDGKLLTERPLVASVAVAEGGFFKRTTDGFWMWWEGE